MRKFKDIFGSLSELKETMVEGVDFRTIVQDRQSPLTVVSIHGGVIEAGTSHLAKAIAGSVFNLYDFQGLLAHDPWRLHITSTRFQDDLLDQLLTRSACAVSVHGLGDADEWTVWVGGLNDSLKTWVGLSLERAGFSVNHKPEYFKGEHQSNVVNRPESFGVQLEIPNELITTFFEEGLRFSTEQEPVLSKAGSKFVEAVLEGLFTGSQESLLSTSNSK